MNTVLPFKFSGTFVLTLIFVIGNISGTGLTIRVLLNSYPLNAKTNITCTSDHGFILQTAQKKPTVYRSNKLILRTHKKSLYKNPVYVIPQSRSFSLDGQTYYGILKVHNDPDQKNLLLINMLPLDEYLYSVLRYESLSFWPLEMQKVQAVTSRTYALYQMYHNKHSSYDIKNTNAHQVYRGIHDCKHLREAITQTHNLVLMYRGKPALTMFDICCGSLIPAHMKDKDHKKPYLYRSHACTFCRTKKNFAWHTVLNKQTILEALKKDTNMIHKTKNLGKLTRVCIHEKDRAGIVHHLALHGTHGSCLISPKKLAKSLGMQLKSTAFSLNDAHEQLVLKGLGFGHNVGLCQLGARELVARSHNFKQILRFYFPGTHLMQVA